jgi:hypothetical protein
VQLVPPDDRLIGRWQRTLLTTVDGRRDTTTAATWLQARTYYVDLRAPVPAADLSSVRCLRDLSHDQAFALAGMEGFAGMLVADGPWARWVRLVDLQPPAPTLDEGRLVQHPDGLVETGRDGGYEEHWHRSGATTASAAGMLLREPSTGATGILVRVGDDVGWARGRTLPLTDGDSVADHVAGAATVKAAQDLLDTEVSIGRIGPRGTVLTSSNLPWRAGSALDLLVAGDDVTVADVAPDGTAVHRRWQVVAQEGEPALLTEPITESA